MFLGLNYLIFFFEEEFLDFIDFLSKVVVYYNVKVYIVIVYVSCKCLLLGYIYIFVVIKR